MLLVVFLRLLFDIAAGFEVSLLKFLPICRKILRTKPDDKFVNQWTLVVFEGNRLDRAILPCKLLCHYSFLRSDRDPSRPFELGRVKGGARNSRNRIDIQPPNPLPPPQGVVDPPRYSRILQDELVVRSCPPKPAFLNEAAAFPPRIQCFSLSAIANCVSAQRFSTVRA